jgi:hypothetical protein
LRASRRNPSVTSFADALLFATTVLRAAAAVQAGAERLRGVGFRLVHVHNDGLAQAGRQ